MPGSRKWPETLEELREAIISDRRKFHEFYPVIVTMADDGFDAVAAVAGEDMAKQLAKILAAHICLTTLERTCSFAADLMKGGDAPDKT